MPRGRKQSPRTVNVLQGIPDKPHYLDSIASAEWDRLVMLLDDTGQLSQADGAALARYVMTLSQWQQCQVNIKEQGAVIKGRPNPNVAVAKMHEKTLLSLEDRFGMNAKSRKILGNQEKQKHDNNPMYQLLQEAS